MEPVASADPSIGQRTALSSDGTDAVGAGCTEARPRLRGEPVVTQLHDCLQVDNVRPVVLYQQVEGLPVSPKVSPPEDDRIEPGQVPHRRIPLEPKRRFNCLQPSRQPELPRRGPEIDVDRREREMRKGAAEEPEIEARPVEGVALELCQYPGPDRPSARRHHVRIAPGMHPVLPEAPLGCLSDPWDMDKGVFEHCVDPP